MKRFSRKAIVITALAAGLAAAPVVYAATTETPGPGMFGHRSIMAQRMGPMSMMQGADNMGPDNMGPGAMMTGPGAMMQDGNMMDGMPAPTAEQLAWMKSQLDKLPPDRRAFAEKMMAEHGITLPKTK